MAIPVLLPKQGQSVETCAIIGWKRHVGDVVKTGEVLCEVETDKASFEIESPADGTLLAIHFEAGSQVPVLETIAVIGTPGEKVERLVVAMPTTSPPATAPAQASSVPTFSAATPPASPVSRRIAASPRAKALAAANGLSLTDLHGSGPGGRIIERDVKEALAGGRCSTVTSQPATAAVTASAGRVREIKLTGIHKRIAERMIVSLSTTAQLTLHASADARPLQDFRKKFKESPERLGLRGLTINDMVLFAVSRALLHHEDLNAHFSGDAVSQFADVHLGFAVDTPRGLIVPVIRNAQALSIRAMATEAARLAAACRDSRITPDEMSGATFTVTNLGGLGVESFTPVLNPPQVGILGVSSIVTRPFLSPQGSVIFIPFIGLSLTINHQVIDGAPGARFLQTLAGFISRFDLLLTQ